MSEQSSHGEGSPPPLLASIVGTGLFVGYIPWASGTFGALLGCIVLLIPGVWDPVILWSLVRSDLRSRSLERRLHCAV